MTEGTTMPAEREAIDWTTPKDYWKVKYVYTGSPDAWFEYVGPWPDLMRMMAENLTGVRSMEIKSLGQRYAPADHLKESTHE